jgi:hypothetical protein
MNSSFCVKSPRPIATGGENDFGVRISDWRFAVSLMVNPSASDQQLAISNQQLR